MNSLSNSSALLRHLYDIRTPEDKEISQELEGIKEKLSKRQSVSMEFVFFWIVDDEIRIKIKEKYGPLPNRPAPDF